jgi:hypothetical protein
VTDENAGGKTPIVMIDSASYRAYTIFNPNDWIGESKQIIGSCAAQCSLLNFEIVHLPIVSRKAEKICESRYLELQEQWKRAPWDVRKTNCLVEIPEYHLYIQAYLATVKVLLDLLAQLVSTEGIVDKRVHGFHKKGKEIGGELLQILQTRFFSEYSDSASQLTKLIKEHKHTWIDQVGNLRDGLIHPNKGMSLVMFGLKLQATSKGLKLLYILQPTINRQYFNDYAQKTLRNAENFSKDFLSILKTHPTKRSLNSGHE